MEKVRIYTAINAELEVSKCPCCGSEPIASVELNQGTMKSDKVINHEIICWVCGLNAPITAWEALANAIEKPIDICGD